MASKLNDPMGQAILDFAQTGKDENIIVKSDICDDDIIPASYLFRSYDEMPDIERLALTRCKGNVLDVGAAAGMHVDYLKDKGLKVDAIDISKRSVEYLKSKNIEAQCIDFHDFNGGKYDTILMLMNGIGIAKRLEHLETSLLHAKSLLKEKGKIICDSSDIKYLYQDEDGAMWVDLNTTYYGNFKFQMNYKEHESDWFEWLYVDFEKLETAANNTGFKISLLYQSEDQYLAELTLL